MFGLVWFGIFSCATGNSMTHILIVHIIFALFPMFSRKRSNFMTDAKSWEISQKQLKMEFPWLLARAAALVNFSVQKRIHFYCLSIYEWMQSDASFAWRALFAYESYFIVHKRSTLPIAQRKAWLYLVWPMHRATLQDEWCHSDSRRNKNEIIYNVANSNHHNNNWIAVKFLFSVSRILVKSIKNEQNMRANNEKLVYSVQ